MSDPNDSEAHLFPGLVPIDEFRRRAKRCRRTMDRWRDQGTLVVYKLGNSLFVDVERTAARMRGEDRRRGQKK